MKTLLALLLLAPAALGQLSTFGDLVPLTDTRYGAFGAGAMKLVTNGSDVFLFWSHEEKVRATKLVPGVSRAGLPVLDIDGSDFDVVWTGTHFLVAGAKKDNAGTSFIATTLVDADGLARAPHVIPRPFAMTPRLERAGTDILLLYRRQLDTRATMLNANGELRTPLVDNLVVSGLSPEPRTYVATNGELFLVMTATQGKLIFSTISDDGAVLGAFEVQEDFTNVPRDGALTTKGDDFLAVWRRGDNGPLVMLEVRPGGAPRVVPGTEGAKFPSLVYARDRIHLAYVQGSAVFVQNGSGTPLVEPLAASQRPTSIVSIGTRVFLAWHEAADGQPIRVRDLSAASSRGERAAFTAMSQEILATASSSQAALIVWSEPDGTLRAGVRTFSGDWTEHVIGRDGETAVAADSDGQSFAVLKRTAENVWYVAFLDREGRVTGQSPRGAFTATDMTWNGTGYAVIGVDAQKRVVATIAPRTGSGFIGAKIVALPRAGREIENPRIASDGRGHFAVWQDTDFEICFPICDPYVSEVHAAELDANLNRVEAQNTLPIAPHKAIHPDIVWDGDERYVIVWNNRGTLETRSVRTKSLSSVARIEGIQLGNNAPRAAVVPFGVAVTFGGNQMVLLRDGAEVERRTFEGTIGNDAAAALGTKGILYVQEVARDEMPYHGARRLFTRVADGISPAPAPSAPRIVRAYGSHRMDIAWTINPSELINGYRVEYRVNDGAWNELDEWFDKDTTSFSILAWIPGAEYRFRVRALNDWGVSAYSEEALVRTTSKRRSVR